MLPIRGGAKVLTWTSFPGDSYQVVYKNSLSDPNWTDLSGAITASSLTTSWTDYLAAETPRRFYAERTN